MAGGGAMWQGMSHVTRAISIWQGNGWRHVVGAGDMRTQFNKQKHIKQKGKFFFQKHSFYFFYLQTEHLS